MKIDIPMKIDIWVHDVIASGSAAV